MREYGVFIITGVIVSLLLAVPVIAVPVDGIQFNLQGGPMFYKYPPPPGELFVNEFHGDPDTISGHVKLLGGDWEDYDERLLSDGRKFVVDRFNLKVDSTNNDRSGDIVKLSRYSDSMLIKFDGKLRGTFIIRPIMLNGARRFTIYKSNDAES